VILRKVFRKIAKFTNEVHFKKYMKEMQKNLDAKA